MTDRSARFQNWFQIFSNVAIIFGIGLVVYELNQSKLIAHGQMVDEHISRVTGRNLVMMGEDPRESLAKAALHPADLNEKDAVALDAFYQAVTMGWSSLYYTSEILGVERRWRNGVPLEARLYFSSDPGRRWLKAWGADVAGTFGLTEIVELAEAAARDQSDNIGSRYKLLLAND
jgi:hypothetical protein